MPETLCLVFRSSAVRPKKLWFGLKCIPNFPVLVPRLGRKRRRGNIVPDVLNDAKAALAHANAAFPQREPATKTAVASEKPAPSIGEELAVKKSMVDKAKSALPKMHKGGTVKADGGYSLKAGEHVLTAPEAELAKKHALMASGMKSLAKAGPAAKPKGTATMTVEPMPKTSFTDKILASPKKPGMPIGSISPNPKAGPGWKAQPPIAHPGDTTAPNAKGVVKI
jgi:hypothetical protein